MRQIYERLTHSMRVHYFFRITLAACRHVNNRFCSQLESTNEARAGVTGKTVKNIVLIGTVLIIVLVAVAVVTLATRMTLI